MLGEVLDRIETLRQQTIHLFQEASFEQALSSALEAETLARQFFTDHIAHAEALSDLAAVHNALSDFGQAEGMYRQALAICRHSIGEHHPTYARNLCNLAVVCQRLGKVAQAEEMYLEALEIRRATIGDKNQVYAINLNNLAKLYEEQGNYAAAEPMFRQSLDVVRLSMGEESSAFARALLALGEFYDSKGGLYQAEPLLLRAVQVMGQTVGETHPDYAACITSLGDLCRKMGKYRQAEQLLLQAGQVLREIHDETHPTYVANLSRLANVYQENGDLARADPILHQVCESALRVYGEMHEAYARALSNLGLLHFHMADLELADHELRRALEIRRAVLGEHDPHTAVSMCNLARVSDVRGDPKAAAPLYRHALEVLRETVGENDPTYANCLNDIGAMYERLDRFDEALPYARQTCAIWGKVYGNEHPHYATGLNNLANLYDSLGHFGQAEEAYREAANVLRCAVGVQHPSYAGCLKNLAGLCAAQSRIAEALELLQQIQTVEQQMIGNVFAFGSERQRMIYLRALQDDFFTYISLVLSDPGRSTAAVAAAFDVVLRRKAIGAEAHAVQRDSVLGGKYPELRPMLEQLTLLRMQIAQKALARRDIEEWRNTTELLENWNSLKDRLQSELARQIPEMNLEQHLQAVDRQAVAALLPATAALIEFVRFDLHDFRAVKARDEQRWQAPRYVAFVLPAGKPDNVVMIDLGEAAFIDQLIGVFRDAVTNPPEDLARDMVKQRANPVPASHSHAGLALRSAVFDKLLPALGDYRRLLLAPDGELCRLPFEILPTEDGNYLIDDYEITYLSTGRDVLRFVYKSHRQPSAPLVVADPNFDLVDQGSADLSEDSSEYVRHSRDQNRNLTHFEPVARLPGTRMEGQRIANLLGAPLWLSSDAQEGLLKEACRSPRILHLATHGFFLKDEKRDSDDDSRTLKLEGRPTEFDRASPSSGIQNPLLRSGLILAGFNTWLKGGRLPKEAEDGLLTAEDVCGLDLLDTDLVVLSACHTGEGEIHAGEGVFGLRRSFMLAGAKTLVMSLWAVPDDQTQELMETFYRNIIGGQPPPEALRSAQLAVKAKYPHPFFWGAFICQGNPGPLTQTLGSRAVRASCE